MRARRGYRWTGTAFVIDSEQAEIVRIVLASEPGKRIAHLRAYFDARYEVMTSDQLKQIIRYVNAHRVDYANGCPHTGFASDRSLVIA